MPKPRTIRISNLSQNTTKDDLFQYFGLTDEDVLELSLAATVTKNGIKKTATITFADKAQLKKAMKLHSKKGKLHDVVVGVDDTFRGFTPLSEGTTVDIVALHGLNGHAFETWMGPERGRMWLRDILPKECPGARVLTYGYNANTFKEPSTGSVKTFAQPSSHFCYPKGTPNRPLVLVAHSLGGIVLKQALIDANTRGDGRFKDILESLRGVVFLGTPHKGGKGVPLGLFITSLLKSLNTGMRSNLIRELDPKSKHLFNMTNDFYQIIHKQGIKIRTFFEEKETKFGFWPLIYRIKIVTEESATLGVAEEVRVGIDGDHLSMCKFRGEFEATQVCDAIRGLYTSKEAVSPGVNNQPKRPDVQPTPNTSTSTSILSGQTVTISDSTINVISGDQTNNKTETHVRGVPGTDNQRNTTNDAIRDANEAGEGQSSQQPRRPKARLIQKGDTYIIKGPTSGSVIGGRNNTNFVYSR